MKIKILIAVFIVLTGVATVVCFKPIHRHIMSKRMWAFEYTQAALRLAASELAEKGTFTNQYPDYCHIYLFTNRYTIGATEFQCCVAADSWDYRDRSNLLATVTWAGPFFFIDQHGAIPVSGFPPNYVK